MSEVLAQLEKKGGSGGGNLQVLATNTDSYTFTDSYSTVLVVASSWRDVTNCGSVGIAFTLSGGTSSTLLNQSKNYYNSSGGMRAEVAYNVKSGDKVTISRITMATGYSIIVAV